MVSSCCSANTSVGAMNAPWYPPCTAISSAVSATTVLPEPTSPCSSRCIGAGLAMSSAICAIAAAWSSVSGNGSAAWNAGTSSPSTACTIPVASAASARLRATSASCMRRNSSNLSRCARRDLVGHRGRAVDVVVGTATVDEVVVGPQRGVERIGEPARLGALQARRHRAPQLPGVHLRLPRLRVHGNDGAGDVGRRPPGRRARRRPGWSSGACPGSSRPCRTARPACPAAAAVRATPG